MKIYEIINIAALAFAIFFKKKHSQPKYLALFLLTCILIESVVLDYMSKVIGMNLPALNIFIIFTVFYYQYILLEQLRKNRYYKILWFLMPVCITASIINYFIGQGPREINNYTYSLGLIVTCILIIIYYRTLINDRYNPNLFSIPMVWFSLGILLFYVCAFPMITFSKSLLEQPDSELDLNFLIEIANILLSSGYLMAAIMRSKFNYSKVR